MSRHLAPSKTQELLDSLRNTVSGFAEREEELERTHRNRSFVARRDLEEALATEQAKLESDLAQAELYFTGLRTRSEERDAQRRAAIMQHHVSARQNFNVRAEGQRGNKISHLQQQTVLATRDKENALEIASAAYENFKTEIQDDRARFIRLKRHARSSFRGYWQFLLMLSGKRASRWELGDVQPDAPEGVLVASLRKSLDSVEEELDALDRQPLPKLFKYIPFAVILVLAIGGGVLVASLQGWNQGILAATGIVVLALLGIHTFGRTRARQSARSIAENLERSRRIFNAAQERAKHTLDSDCARIEKDHAAQVEKLEAEWGTTQESAAELRARGWKKLDAQKERLIPMAAALFERRIAELDAALPVDISRIRSDSEARSTALTEGFESEEARFLDEYNASWAGLQSDWKAAITPIYDEIDSRIAHAREDFPDWDRAYLDRWEARTEFIHAAKLGQLNVDVVALAGKTPQDERLALPGAGQFALPVTLGMPHEGSLLLETDGPGRAEQIGTLNNLIVRLLATTPPGKLKFTIIDPVGLGENFAGLMHLADYEESLINSRIWTQKAQIEEKLAELNEHIEKIIQMYLRNEYETHHRIQRGGRKYRGEIQLPDHRRLPEQLQRSRDQTPD